MIGIGKRVVAVIAAATLCAGCATSGKSTGFGAALGAAAGGILGVATGQDAGTTAAMMAGGAAIGAAAGYGIHKRKAKKLQTAEQAAQEYKYQASEGLKLDMRKADVAPRVSTPGQTVSATMQYATLGSGAATTPELTETFTLIPPAVANGDKSEPILLSEEVLPLEDGVWESGLEVELPKDLAPGEYVLAQQVEADGKTVMQRSTFVVGTQTAAAN